jgi:AraC-like DNA-binding protein
MNSIFYLSFFGFGQAILLCLALMFTIKKWQVNNYLFVAFQAILSLIFLRSLLVSSGTLTENPQYIGWALWVLFMAPPLAYFYMRSALSKDYQLPKYAWLHFIPAILGGICSVFMFTEDPVVRKEMLSILLKEQGVVDSSQSVFFWFFHAEQILFSVQIMFYLWCSRHTLNIEISDNSYLKANIALVKWMRFIRYSILVFVVVTVLSMVIGNFIPIGIFPIVSLISYLILLLMVLSTFWHAVKCINMSITGNAVNHGDLNKTADDVKGYESAPAVTSVEQDATEIHIIDLGITPDNEKYEKSKLSQQRIEQLATQFDVAMCKEKYFLNDELSISDVAIQLECSPNHLSQAINTVYEKTFTELVSGMRIDEAKKLLRASPKTTVLDISLMAGFQSKSAFYKSFKKYTGLTPVSYRKSCA